MKEKQKKNDIKQVDCAGVETPKLPSAQEWEKLKAEIHSQDLTEEFADEKLKKDKK